MKNTCWRPFSYLILDREGAQRRLNAMAARGWALDRVRFGLLARFRRTWRTDLRYFLDWSDPLFQEDPDYLQLCADAGWEPVQEVEYLNLYASRPGTSPSPIQTDPELEYQRFRKKVLRRMGIGVAVCLFALLPLLFDLLSPSPSPAWLTAPLLSSSLIFSALPFLLPCWLAGGAAYLILLLRRLWVWRRQIRAGRPLTGLAPWASRLWGGIRALGYLSLGLIIVFLLGDILLNGLLNPSYLVGALIGCGLVLLWRRKNPRRKPPPRSMLALLGAMVLCALLHGPARTIWPSRIPQPPALGAQSRVIPGTVQRRDSLLGSQARWQEEFPLADRGDEVCTVSCTAYTWSSPALAERFLSAEAAGMAPLPEEEGSWHSTVVARGSSYLILNWYLRGPGVPPLEEAAAWLEALEGSNRPEGSP